MIAGCRVCLVWGAFRIIYVSTADSFTTQHTTLYTLLNCRQLSFMLHFSVGSLRDGDNWTTSVDSSQANDPKLGNHLFWHTSRWLTRIPSPRSARCPRRAHLRHLCLIWNVKVRAKTFYCVQLELSAETKGTCTFQDSAARASALEFRQKHMFYPCFSAALKMITMTNSLQLMRGDQIAAVAVTQGTLTLSFVI